MPRYLVERTFPDGLSIPITVVRPERGAAQRPEGQATGLVATVRAATERLRNPEAATAAGYALFHGCVSGPQEGAMGVHYVGAPNRYGIPAFYELHVWAWKANPNGAFADWNPTVSCDDFTPPVTGSGSGRH